MAAVDPNRPGYYMDGTPIPSRTDPEATNRVAAMQAGFGESQPQAQAQSQSQAQPQPIRKSGNPYNNPSKKPIYMTADNQIADGPGKGVYAYYGVPGMELRTQFNAQNEFKDKMEQWAKEFAETQSQNKFDNGISEGTLTGYYNGKKTISTKTGGTNTAARKYYVNGVLQS